MTELSAYLRTEASRPYRLGSADCVTLAARWIELRRGIDPLAQARGYEEAAVPPWSFGVRMAERALFRIGLPRTDDPQPGDVAVVMTFTYVAAAIRTQRNWAMRLENGLALVAADRCRVIAAWRV